ncbi:hypothetical protein HK098_006432 [Nowakowskiella sp. JEL0407]|nr:hypothetical protein HK098_006432 [Nowakowskiella sp. JEL0407]
MLSKSILSFLVLCLAVTTVIALPASAPSMSSQAELSEAARILFENGIADQKGYAGLEFTDDNSLYIWWKGTPDTKVFDILKIAKLKVRLRFMPAKFSREELNAAADSLKPLVEDPNNPFHTISIDFRGSGVQLLGDKTLKASNGSSLVNQLPFKFRKLPKNVPLNVRNSRMQRKFSRDIPDPPYYGGMGIYSDFGSTTGGLNLARCTSGFSVMDSQKNRYILTAAHCRHFGIFVKKSDTQFTFIGNVTSGIAEKDVMLIKNDLVGGMMYDGPVGGSTTKPVIGYSRAALGQRICRTGVKTGTICNLKVVTINRSICIGSGVCIDGTIQVAVTPESGPVAASTGDSGGPIYYNTSTGAIVGLGTLTSGGTYLYPGETTEVASISYIPLNMSLAIDWQNEATGARIGPISLIRSA